MIIMYIYVSSVYLYIYTLIIIYMLCVSTQSSSQIKAAVPCTMWKSMVVDPVLWDVKNNRLIMSYLYNIWIISVFFRGSWSESGKM